MADAEKIRKLKANIVRTLETMEKADQERNWSAIHYDHYDWWVAPIKEPSNTYGPLYSVSEADVAELVADQNWIQNYHRAISLVFKSWGWDIQNANFFEQRDESQNFNGPTRKIRLQKILKSLELFNKEAMLNSAKKFYDEIQRLGIYQM